MFISYNSLAASRAQRAVSFHTKNYAKNVEQLATYKRVNSAADDPGSISIIAKMKAKIASADAAKANVSDAISLLSTADTALGSIADLLSDIRADVVSATTGTPTAGEVDGYQTSINANIAAIDAISQQTFFNSYNLLDGSQNFTIQTGTDDGQTSTLNFAAAAGTGIAISVTQAEGGADGGHMVEGVSTAGFALEDLSVGAATVDNYAGANVATTTNALDVIDTMISNVSRMRSVTGGHSNAMSSVLDHLTGMQAGWEMSRANHEDVDVAKASTELAQNQILKDSAAAMVAQANSNFLSVLSFLPSSYG